MAEKDEVKSIGDFMVSLNTKLKNFITSTAKEKADAESVDQFKDNPLKRGDSRKSWIKKIQNLFVHMEIQDKMEEKHYGSFGEKTEAAVKEYQKQKEKEETGEIDKDLMEMIIKDITDKGVNAITWEK
jgi:hypothetical protein